MKAHFHGLLWSHFLHSDAYCLTVSVEDKESLQSHPSTDLLENTQGAPQFANRHSLHNFRKRPPEANLK